ncbi:MAG: hypothetical protein V7693_16150 [Halopseudomonas sabulinigri]
MTTSPRLLSKIFLSGAAAFFLSSAMAEGFDITNHNLPVLTANVVVESQPCPGVGAKGFNSVGKLLSCQAGFWSRHEPVDPGAMCGFQSNWGTTGNGCLGYNMYTQGCPAGYSLNDWQGEIGQDRRFMFCTKN